MRQAYPLPERRKRCRVCGGPAHPRIQAVPASEEIVGRIEHPLYQARATERPSVLKIAGLTIWLVGMLIALAWSPVLAVAVIR